MLPEGRRAEAVVDRGAGLDVVAVDAGLLLALGLVLLDRLALRGVGREPDLGEAAVGLLVRP